MSSEGLSMGMSMIPLDELQMIETYRLGPFQQTSGIEVLENMTTQGGGLSPLYESIRTRLIENGLVIVGAIGPSGASKGSLLMGLWRVAHGDRYLQSQRQIEIASLPFSITTQVMRTASVRLETPELWIPPTTAQGQYTSSQYAAISQKMAELARARIENRGDKALLLLIESSSPTAFPMTDTLPLIVEGIDRGNSPLFELALDPKYASTVEIYALEKLRVVSQFVEEWREPIHKDKPDLEKVFDPQSKVIMVLKDVNGEEVLASDLPAKHRQELAEFLTYSMAPTETIRRSDREFESLITSLYERGVINIYSMVGYYTALQDRLRLPSDRFHVISNPLLTDPKTYDLSYLLDSLPTQNYPEILPPFYRTH